ncbi:MAG: hypothetical protein PHV23_02325 [Candidatus Gracilibacteria bacterium]|nr:hypothetical protein [Candidatus Gracilibacteria bacterium]
MPEIFCLRREERRKINRENTTGEKTQIELLKEELKIIYRDLLHDIRCEKGAEKGFNLSLLATLSKGLSDDDVEKIGEYIYNLFVDDMIEPGYSHNSFIKIYEHLKGIVENNHGIHSDVRNAMEPTRVSIESIIK